MVIREAEISETTKSRVLRARFRSATGASPPGRAHQHPLEDLELLEALAGADRHRGEWALRDVDRHPGLVPQALVEAPKQSAPTREDDPLVHDVAGELGRRAVERGLDRVDDRGDGLLD